MDCFFKAHLCHCIAHVTFFFFFFLLLITRETLKWKSPLHYYWTVYRWVSCRSVNFEPRGDPPSHNHYTLNFLELVNDFSAAINDKRPVRVRMCQCVMVWYRDTVILRLEFNGIYWQYSSVKVCVIGINGLVHFFFWFDFCSHQGCSAVCICVCVCTGVCTGVCASEECDVLL